jgi:hypothetical protein
MVKVAQAIAAPFNHFDLIVQPLDKAAGVAVMKIVRDFLQPLLQCAEEGVKARESAFLNSLDPTLDLALGPTFDDVEFKNSG